MLTGRIIPCLDIKDGRTVKGVNFEGLRDAGDPVELAARYSREGADELVLLDITATHEGRGTLLQVVEGVARKAGIPFTVGGGISSADDVHRLLRCGADKVSVNSSAVRDPGLITRLAERFGNQCIVVAVDAHERDGRWEVYVSGGRKPTGRDLFEWAQEAQERGAGELLFTSMNHDGTKAGFANEALRKLNGLLSIPIIASGGAGAMEHFRDAFLLGKADAVLAASVFHFGEIGIPQLKEYLQGHGMPMRVT